MSRRVNEPKGANDARDVRAVILHATGQLLEERSFSDLSVADILTRAGVARGSFYFYFESKHDVLAGLTRRAIDEATTMTNQWLEREDGDELDDPEPTVRAVIGGVATFWSEHAALLRAVVENWRTDPKLEELWLQLMGSFAHASQERIAADREQGHGIGHHIDPHTLAAALTWLSERLYYLAAADVEPFNDHDALVDVLTYIWATTLYGPPQANAAT